MMPIERPGVRALRGAAPVMTPEMQRMRDWANSQRTATAANARNGDFILNPVGSGSAPMGVGIPTQMPVPQGPVAVAGDREDAPGRWGSAWASAAPDKPGRWGSAWASAAPDKPGMLPVKPVKPGMEPPPPVKPGMLPVKPVKPGMEPPPARQGPPPDWSPRLTP